MAFVPQSRRRRRSAGGGRAPMAQINVTPLVDVMLVLLVIFMVTAPLLKSGIPITLPQSRAKPMDNTPQQVTVTLTASGEVYLEDKPVANGELADRIAALPKGGDGALPLIALRADAGQNVGALVGLMGELNRAGITNIAIVSSVGGAGAAKPKPADAASGAER
jgi:biopolymer transport protein TolR